MPRPSLRLAVVVCCVSAAAALHAAKVKVEARPDPTFDFGRVQSWAWDADGGEVIMARTAHDDPAPVKARIDPLIRKYVDEAMTKQGLTQATGSTPDLQLHYYVLVTIASEGQTMGQFLPAVPYWGLPAFNPGTSALSVVTRGSLVLDAMIPGTVGDRKVVWRGIAQSTVEDADSDRVRDERIHKAVQELIKRLPRKKK